MFDNLRFVLMNPTHPGNIGAAARAIKVMGFKHMTLVNPKEHPSAESRARASGADDVLSAAQVHTNMTEAISGSTLVVGSSARNRGFDIPVVDLAEGAKIIAAEAASRSVSMVFGTERFGMTNEEMQHCHYLVKVPANPEYSSLNLAMAVQLVAYEVRMSALNTHAEETEQPMYATAEKMESFYAHLFETLNNTGFLESERAHSLQQKLRVMFNRLRPEKHELDILRGILSSINKKLKE